MLLNRTPILIIGVCVLMSAQSVEAAIRPSPDQCTYEMQVWNVNLKSSVGLKQIRHAYAEILPAEIDPATGCTVCSEDQISIDIPPLSTFFVCYKVAPRVRSVLENLIRNNEPIFAVVGYRVIKSRGGVDVNGNRTEFSNHSFGTAIDINPEQNGLYDNCVEFGPQCRLLRGGEWRPGAPGSLGRNSEIVSLFKQAGFQWGGEIAGKQKDFMHFSLTGY